MNLTRDQILEMTETIALACGWKPINDGVFVHLENTEDFMGNLDSFEPFLSWDDVFTSSDALEVGPIAIYPIALTEGMKWRVTLGFEGQVDGTHSSKLTAFCLALHEAAKAKLEGYQNEDGN